MTIAVADTAGLRRGRVVRRQAGGGGDPRGGGSLRIDSVRGSKYSRSRIWIDAAIGIASSAPSMPSSVLPSSTDTIVTNGCTFTVRFCTWGWITWFSNCW